jgi:LPS-assembly lipoprotein
LRALIVGLAFTVLAGCGFHLRGSQSLPFESIYVGAPANSELGAALRRSIRAGSGTRIADSPQEAEAILAVVGESREKTILTLDTAGRVREFQLRYRFVFRVHDGKGTDLLPQTEILLTRDFTFNDSTLLAKEQEEALLYADMQKDLVQQIVRRLAAARPLQG